MRQLLIRLVDVASDQTCNEYPVPTGWTESETRGWAHLIQAMCGDGYRTEIPHLEEQLDDARRRGPHRLGCAVDQPDPDGINACVCEPVRLADSPTMAAALETAFGGGQ